MFRGAFWEIGVSWATRTDSMAHIRSHTYTDTHSIVSLHRIGACITAWKKKKVKHFSYYIAMHEWMNECAQHNVMWCRWVQWERETQQPKKNHTNKKKQQKFQKKRDSHTEKRIEWISVRLCVQGRATHQERDGVSVHDKRSERDKRRKTAREWLLFVT